MILTAGDLASAIAVTVLEENDRLAKRDRDKKKQSHTNWTTKINFLFFNFIWPKFDFCLPLFYLNVFRRRHNVLECRHNATDGLRLNYQILTTQELWRRCGGAWGHSETSWGTNSSFFFPVFHPLVFKIFLMLPCFASHHNHVRIWSFQEAAEEEEGASDAKEDFEVNPLKPSTFWIF